MGRSSCGPLWYHYYQLQTSPQKNFQLYNMHNMIHGLVIMWMFSDIITISFKLHFKRTFNCTIRTAWYTGWSLCECSVISLLSASNFTSKELSTVQYAQHDTRAGHYVNAQWYHYYQLQTSLQKNFQLYNTHSMIHRVVIMWISVTSLLSASHAAHRCCDVRVNSTIGGLCWSSMMSHGRY